MKTKKIIIVIIGLIISILMLPLAGCDEPNAPGAGEGTLSLLTLSTGTLSPAFDSEITEYSVFLETWIASNMLIIESAAKELKK